MGIGKTLAKRMARLGLEMTGDTQAEGVVGGVPMSFRVHSAGTVITVRVAPRPAFDLGLAFENGELTGDDPANIEALWGPEGREFADELPDEVAFAASDAAFELEVAMPADSRGGRPPVRDFELEAMARWGRALANVVRAMRERASAKGAAEPLKPFEPAARAFATAHGLSYQGAPFSVFGNVPEAGLLIVAQRTEAGSYAMVAKAWPEGQAIEGLTLASNQLVGPAWVEVSGDDVDLAGGPAASRFKARSTRPDEAREALHRDVQAVLVQLADQGLPVSIRDGAIELAGIELDPGTPSQVAEVGERLLALARLLARKSGQPYR